MAAQGEKVETSVQEEDETAETEESEELSAVSRRNENVAVYQIDTDALKELDKRVGVRLNPVSDVPVELNFYSVEFGRPPNGVVVSEVAAPIAGWGGQLFAFHQNSVLNARSFFQVGEVQPSRLNNYGMLLGGPVPVLGDFTFEFGQRKVRGMVNGNVLVPLASERTPLTTDPELAEVVQSFLDAYPDELPNRPDFDRRALNTNSPQNIDGTLASIRWDRNFGDQHQVSIFDSITRQNVDAFQLVAGQNPDTEIRGHRFDATYRRLWSPSTILESGFRFDSTKSVLEPEENAVGPRVRFGFQIEELGPESMFPIDRTLETFSGGLLLSKELSGGDHTLTLGGDLTRVRLDGLESYNLRGYFQFTNNFGRSAIENFRYGTPSKYEVTIGDVIRHFRNWRATVFFGDRWQLTDRFQLYYGLRYELETAPTERDGLDAIPYGCDCNNFSPRLALAYRLGSDWVARASYSLSYGQIYPVTYQQIRNNAPRVKQFQVQNPSLLDPLAAIDLDDPDVRTSPLVISPDVVAPYSHQYNLLFEGHFGPTYSLSFGYVGSRSVKLFNSFATNRGEIFTDIPLTPETVDLRRADPRYTEVLNIVNGGNGYLNGFQINFQGRYLRGLSWRGSYTFSKSIDQGPDYASTAANKELYGGRNQWERESFSDKKGLSNFDSPHALVVSFAYDLPTSPFESSLAKAILNGWQISGAGLLKTGTPFTLYVGSDSPGFGNVDGSPSERPNIVDDSILGRTVAHPDTAPLILSRDRFAYIETGTPRGNLGRNTFRKAPIRNLNIALTKNWRWVSRRSFDLMFRVEAYNVTNTPQFDEPHRNLSSPAFGTITNTMNDGRILQLGLRLGF